MPKRKPNKMTDKELVRALFSKDVRKALKTSLSAPPARSRKKAKKK
jgi:hypothetical protein